MKYIILISIFLSSLLYAEYNFTYKIITTEDGLSNSTVNTILQDKYGLMWIGTLNGLNKYDGYNFQKFNYNRENTNSLSGNRVYSLLYEEESDNLWVGLFDGGLNKININTLKINRYNIALKKDKIIGKHIRNIFKDSKGYIWISTNGKGLKRFSPKTQEIKHYLHRESDKNTITSNYIRMVYEDNRHNLWIATKGSGILTRYDYPKNKFIKYNIKIEGKNIEWITGDNNNKLFVGTRDGALNVIDLQKNTNKALYFRKKNNQILKESLIRKLFFETTSNLLWIGTEKGLFIYDITKNKFDTIKGLENIHVRSIFKDKMGLIWIGTLSKGLIKINKNTLPVKYLFHDKNNNNSLIDDVVWNIYEDKNKNLWVSTTNGLTIYDNNNNFIKKYLHSDNNKFSMSESNATSIIDIDTKTKWLGTYGAGIEIFDAQNETFTNINKKSKIIPGLTSNYISKLFKDSKNNIWIGTYDAGLNLYLKNENKFKIFKNTLRNNCTLKSNQIRDIIEDRNKNLWIATYGGGLFLYKNKKFKNYTKKFKNKSLAINNSIYSISYDSLNNYIWGATEAGYIIFDLNTMKFIEFDFLKRLNNKVLISVIVDKNHDIWFSSGKGIFWVKFKDKKLFQFDKKDGLFTDEFNENAYSLKNDNTICFGSKKGAILFNSNKIKINKKEPSISLISIKIDGKNYKNKDMNISETKNLKINYDNHIITFKFSIIDYLDTNKNTYQYRIIGFTNNWSDFTTSNRLVFTTSKPGKYTLMIKGKNSKQILSKNNIEINIEVIPPFYKKGSFITITIIVFSLIIFIIIKYRISSIKKANKLLEQKVNEKTKELYETNKKLEEMALSDSLTGLRNRYFFKVVLKDEINNFIQNKLSTLNNPKREGDNNNNVMGIFMVDLDHFKLVNDKYGHDSGDIVLKELADVFKKTTRGSDAIIRWGGEEFLIILKNCQKDYLDIYCNKLLTEVNCHNFKVLSGEKTIKKSCSIGYVSYPILNQTPNYIDLEHAIIIADLALYYAKENGRNKGVRLDISEFLPPKENIHEYLDDLNKALNVNFLKIGKIINGERND